MLIYDCIKEIADLSGIKMGTLAKQAGVSINTMKKWNKADPSATALLNIAQFLGVSVDYLLGYSDNPFSHKNTGIVSRNFLHSLEQLSSATHNVQEAVSGILSEQKGVETNTEVVKDSEPLDTFSQVKT